MVKDMTRKTGLVQTLLELHRTQGSGVLRIERIKEKKQLVLKEGMLAYAESNLPQEHLARIMVSADLLPKDNLKEITALMKAGKTSEAAIKESCHCDAQILTKGRYEQAMAILASLLDWEEYTTHFYPGENLVRYQVSLSLALPELLVLSARRAFKDRSLNLRSELSQDILSLDQSFNRKDICFTLNQEESYVCSLLSENMNAADLLSLIPAGEAAPEELLRRLICLGLIKIEPKISSSSELNPLVTEIEEMALRFENANAYAILSVKTDAAQVEIQAAYHELAKRFHPDRFQSIDFSVQDRVKAEQLFTSINTAYTLLRDPLTRASYDETRIAKESAFDAALKSKAAKSEEEAQVEALFQEGRASLARRDFPKAVEQLKNCAWFNPKKASFNYYLGLAELEISEFRKSAEQHLLKAIELESMSVDSHLALAKLYIKVMLPRKAEIQIHEALQLDPQNAEAHKLLNELGKNEKTDGAFRWRR
jgi:curved DNA-binding protein CbpA